ncbi:transketolase [Deinococcus deserti]|uniref:Transketolase n=1 Tax=Deinococcus deserti (strain DSM 17065 / CIP 109153 / LMG 22923 / VCD115) TaxID=546414 RepID=C1CXQ1_DEIDV|nr:transketolase [Deinococcus deserti]ACO44857.1 putative Transketolase [Deinococcus deserti VCD115]
MSTEQLSINTIRTLSIDAVQAANSGHPGAPLGMAPMAYVVWQEFLRFNPKQSQWAGRDRFVLSAGHASMLIYSLLHLTGYDMPMEDLKNFRQWGSKTPGHPEFFHTPGLDATTGPLGQGAAMTVGLAMAEAHLAERYNRPEFPIFDNHVYSILGDGDLQEGINHEAAALAGHLRLGKLIWLHDDNQIQLDTPTEKAESEDTAARFRSYGWEVLRVEDGNDLDQIRQAITAAKANTAQPSLIQVRTVIGFGSPRAGTSKAHGEPLGEEGVAQTKQALGWDYPAFTVPDEVRAHMDATERGAKYEAEWNALLEGYRAAYPDLGREVDAMLNRELPANLADVLPSYEVGGKAVATRNASGEVINALAKVVPGLMGGSADLSGSTKTTIKDGGEMQAGQMGGRNVLFGVREFGMAAAGNGLSLYGAIRPLVGTFLVFADYLKPAFRLSAIQMQPVTYVLTHDSIGLGEDGPTHQPIEQLAMLRSVPGAHVIRPADANETAAAWQMALEYDKGPTAIALSRQDLPILPRNHAGVKKGAYVLRDPEGAAAQVILIASGSEVSLALDAAEALAAEGIGARVVSMPCMEVFRAQDASYRDSVLTPGVKRVAIEAASKSPWYEWTQGGPVIGMDTFGASAPAKVLFEKFGFSVPNVVKVVKSVL